jgi:WD40 repeat protein
VAGAIGQSAEILFNEQLKPLEQAAARRLILRLVSPGEGVPDTRRPIAVADLQGDAEPKIVRRVMGALVEARLLTIDRNSIQLAHEAIIKSWPRLRDWINESRDDLRVQQRIERAAMDWQEADRDPDLLYHGTPLTTAREWQKEHGQDLNLLEREFLEAAAELEQIEQSKAQAEAQRVRTNRRLAFTSLTVLTIAALVLSVVAFSAFHRARNNEQAANQRLSQSLASQAVELVNQNPRLALALAAEVIERTPSPPIEARIALVNATTALASAPYAPASTPKVVGDALTVVVHPSEEIIVTGNRDGTIELWSALGQPIGKPFKGHSGAVEEIVFSPSGTKMLSAGLDGKVMAWDFIGASLNAHPIELVDLKTILWSVAISPDVSKMATASEDGTIRLFDLNNAMEIEVMVDLSRDFISVQFSPDGKLLFAGNGMGEVWSWRVSTGEQLLAPFPAHQSDAWEIVFHPSEPVFATASSDGRVRVWDLDSGDLIAEPFAGIAANVRGVQIDANGLLMAGDENGQLQFWQSDTRTYLGASAAHHDSQVIDASLQHTGSLFVSLGLDHVLRTWRRSSGGLNRQIAYHDAGAYGLAVSGDARRLATGDGSGHVRVFDSNSAQVIGLPLTVSPHRIWALGLDHAGRFVAAGDQKGTMALWEVDSGRLIARRMQAHEGSIVSVSFHPSENILVSAGSDGIVRKWNSETLEPLSNQMAGHQGGVTRLAFSPNGESLAVTDRAGWIRIWDVASSSILQEWSADDNTIWSVAWSPEGTQLATAHADEVVTVWNVKSQTPVNIMTPHPGGATDVVFLADGVSVATTSRDGTVRLWDRALGLHIGTALGRPGATQWRLATGRSASWFVSTRSDGAVEFWDLLDMETVCRRAVWGTDAQRRYLGEGESPIACAIDQ